MMSTNVVVTATVKVIKVDATVVPGKFEVEVVGFGKQEVDTPEATFANVPAGDYTATVVRVDAAGAPIGDKQSATFTIVPETQDVNVPDAVTVTVSVV